MAPIELPGPHAELGDRSLGLGHDGLLAGDGGQVAERRVERLGVAQRLAETDVDDDLREARHLHRVLVLELLLQRGHDLGRVALLEAAGHAFTSSCWPQCRQTRTRRPVSRVAWAIRVGLPQLVQTSMTREIGSGCAISRMPPWWIFGVRSLAPADWRGLVCRLAMLMPSMTTFDPAGRRVAAEDAAGPARVTPGGGSPGRRRRACRRPCRRARRRCRPCGSRAPLAA